MLRSGSSGMPHGKEDLTIRGNKGRRHNRATQESIWEADAGRGWAEALCAEDEIIANRSLSKKRGQRRERKVIRVGNSVGGWPRLGASERDTQGGAARIRMSPGGSGKMNTGGAPQEEGHGDTRLVQTNGAHRNGGGTATQNDPF